MGSYGEPDLLDSSVSNEGGHHSAKPSPRGIRELIEGYFFPFDLFMLGYTVACYFLSFLYRYAGAFLQPVNLCLYVSISLLYNRKKRSDDMETDAPAMTDHDKFTGEDTHDAMPRTTIKRQPAQEKPKQKKPLKQKKLPSGNKNRVSAPAKDGPEFKKLNSLALAYQKMKTKARSEEMSNSGRLVPQKKKEKEKPASRAPRIVARPVPPTEKQERPIHRPRVPQEKRSMITKIYKVFLFYSIASYWVSLVKDFMLVPLSYIFTSSFVVHHGESLTGVSNAIRTSDLIWDGFCGERNSLRGVNGFRVPYETLYVADFFLVCISVVYMIWPESINTFSKKFKRTWVISAVLLLFLVPRDSPLYDGSMDRLCYSSFGSSHGNSSLSTPVSIADSLKEITPWHSWRNYMLKVADIGCCGSHKGHVVKYSGMQARSGIGSQYYYYLDKVSGSVEWARNLRPRVQIILESSVLANVALLVARFLLYYLICKGIILQRRETPKGDPENGKSDKKFSASLMALSCLWLIVVGYRILFVGLIQLLVLWSISASVELYKKINDPAGFGDDDKKE